MLGLGREFAPGCPCLGRGVRASPRAGSPSRRRHRGGFTSAHDHLDTPARLRSQAPLDARGGAAAGHLHPAGPPPDLTPRRADYFLELEMKGPRARRQRTPARARRGRAATEAVRAPVPGRPHDPARRARRHGRSRQLVHPRLPPAARIQPRPPALARGGVRRWGVPADRDGQARRDVLRDRRSPPRRPRAARWRGDDRRRRDRAHRARATRGRGGHARSRPPGARADLPRGQRVGRGDGPACASR